MKVPKTFIPEKDLNDRVNDYLNNDKYSRKNNSSHRDPNLNQIIAILGVILRLEGKSSREIEQYFVKFSNNSEEDGCIYAFDFFKAAEPDLPKNVNDAMSVHFKNEYHNKVKVDIINSYLNDKLAIPNSVMDYINMVIGIDAQNLGPNNTWRYLDPKTKLPKTIKIDINYMQEVEKHLGLNKGHVESFRHTIREVYAEKISNDPYYDFMDHIGLVEAVTNVKLEAEMGKVRGLMSSLTDRSNEENKQVYNRVINNMINYHGYCEVCAKKTIEYFITRIL